MCFKSKRGTEEKQTTTSLPTIFNTTTTEVSTFELKCPPSQTECEYNYDDEECENGICCAIGDQGFCVCKPGYQGTTCEEFSALESKAGFFTLNTSIVIFVVFLLITAIIIGVVFYCFRKRKNARPNHTTEEGQQLSDIN